MFSQSETDQTITMTKIAPDPDERPSGKVWVPKKKTSIHWTAGKPASNTNFRLSEQVKALILARNAQLISEQKAEADSEGGAAND